ncbi:pyridine nucleotide-disulfide oxidoreductase [Rhodobacter veldkampii DSM 11550]|uniref:Pyridine nucleotide-disulfide oxidoreductase n=1 Tax=Phaeovulum veldkampii DSM 11550 TaxID=1185920 RepID=A0A2T4JJG6_9RHOB|nr:FAD-dependent oxidoreductase [Phaeovulum veldkampii]MBK5946324.1 pyridine nucleotide-disulfide oxidoreductase [Phaeovulum veldkampii DSM 11550]PTE18049.1 pyridine nucleotide-disulfide oxidoreductase [Phaeovulum veldkampii DSM 11550]TDQ60129.1 3-phenylpropionate/trans-cinnamate dioxygenase ferredoxin reductase subunit [Phaeovulum veldkampii DSM 11550]
MAGIVIVGAGQAAVAAAAKLRALGYSAPISLLGDEPVAPYQRPPLSKAYLLGEMPLDRLTLRGDDFWAEHHITLRLSAPVSAIDRAAKTVHVAGEDLPYDQLILTTGATPRRLPATIGGDLAGVHVVRRLADVDAMAPAFRPGARLVVIGGGYVGLEAAAVAWKLGLRVTLVEAAPRILGRVACAETADAIRRLHLEHGVEIIEGVGVERLLGDAHVTGVRLADGRDLAADFVILGIGVTPATALAEAAGLAIDNGITTDAQGRTSDPVIWAAGDCASFPHPGGRIRLESVGNAIDMAELVAENIMGAGLDYAPKPWFWSDQFDAKLQIAGLNTGYDRVVTRGQSFWYFRGAQLLAVDALNDPRAYMIGKRLIEAGRSPDPAALADPETDLKALL